MIRSILILSAMIVLPAQAQVAVSANDGKQVLVDGAQVVPDRPTPDSVTLFDLQSLRVLATLPVPTSVIGPPSSVAIAPDGRFALVTASRKISPIDPKAIVPDDVVSVIALGASPRVSATLHAGAGASGVSISPAGDLALVANRSEGTVSVFAIDRDGVLAKTQTLTLGEAKSAPAMPIFYDGGRHALVTRDGDHRISILAIEGGRARLLPETLAPGLRPYEITTAGDRRYAVSANIGGGGRDIDTLALIDLSGPTPRVIDVVAIGLTPEGVRMAPDGRHVAVNVNNGSNASPASPFHHPSGRLQVWKIEDNRLRLVTTAPVGGWGQGVAWSRDGHMVLAQVMVEKRIEAFAFDGRRLKPGGVLPLEPGPAAIAVSGQ